MKLLTYDAEFTPQQFSDKTPYTIMFGPDRCGATNKVHFIFRHKNPKTGEIEEKHMNGTPQAKTDKLSNVYTLVVRPDNTFEVLVNDESVKKGSLLEDFTPAVNPPKMIDDPEDSKPEDWVDLAKISDPEAVKPNDWDESAPREILDEDATMPEDWLENEPKSIPDPEAVKPDDWDNEEDGDFTAPTIDNPKCADVSGCGPWTKPMKPNPDYKGKWKAPIIDNPAYKGVWKARQIENPAWFEDKQPSNMGQIGAIGFELWTMQNGILFDNVYIGDSEKDAKALRKEVWVAKYKIEKEKEKAAKPVDDKHDEAELTMFQKFKSQAIKLRERVVAFLFAVMENPADVIETTKEDPIAAGATALVAAYFVFTIVTVLSSLVSLVTGSGSKKAVALALGKASTDVDKKAEKEEEKEAAEEKDE
ncbi:Calreticulin family-domain-containing protein [Chytriomyces sp. MP71]|nr:Calreticulin family-domain-containing protein [Chytriomyces sp. MP71]